MRSSLLSLSTGALVLCLTSSPLVARGAGASGSDAVYAAYTLLVGSPEEGQEVPGIVLIVPGTVILSEPEVSRYSDDIGDLRGKLMQTYRLGTLDAVTATRAVLVLDQERRMPAVGHDLGVFITLLGADKALATFKVRFTEGERTIAEPVVSVKRTGRAVIATRNGAAAPYAFVLLSPDPKEAADGITQPQVIEQARPAYPEEARKAKTRGVVILEGVVGKDGRVRSVKPLRSLPDGLTEAAVEAYRQWRYEPARNAVGEPVEVIQIVHFDFQLR